MGAGVMPEGRRRRRAAGGGDRGGARPMSEINVTPFVDVMLCLLIIFMVAAPLMTVGVPGRPARHLGRGAADRAGGAADGDLTPRRAR